MEQKLSL